MARYASPADPKWAADTARLIAALKAGVGLPTMINNYGNTLTITAAQHGALDAAADGVLAEGFPVDAGAADPGSFIAGKPVGAQFDRLYAEAVATKGIHYDMAYSAQPLAATSTADITWALAVYLLTWKPGDLFSFTGPGESSRPPAYPPSMSPRLGAPIDPPPPVGSRPYVRRFQCGVVSVDPVGATASITP